MHWRKSPVDPEFLVAGCLAFRKTRIVEEWKANRTLDLEGPRALEENRCRMRIDPVHERMLLWVRQEREHTFLNPGVICF